MILTFLGTLNLLNSPDTSFDDSLVNKGISGNYKYELWNTTDTTGYYLKVWKYQKDSHSTAPRVIGSFNSTQAAFEYLKHHYA
ncbi:hypothetical protein [Calothrix sp. UHCC 0171]|uniref:hypothetical protein n=1 Tax=Calothrix sp. UHCC 0171 TaxID=3110245 RepID=UPI002B20BEBA|nr:hypothetical protein [Calothrix sp. UHCC 0171]MEA5570831.1 hypothetical protein [Calothrix sp. UHCC 0171]